MDKPVIKTNDILVCIADQKTGCGILYVRKGSIVKAAQDGNQYSSWLEVYRNRGDESMSKTVDMHFSNYRVATEEEVALWNDCVYYTRETISRNAVSQ